MNSKIPVKRLSETLAKKAGISADEAESFIKELFSVIIGTLGCGESVTVTGLGTFTVSPNPIEPVTFVPDDEFAAEVNAPFAMFEAEEINEGVDIEELSRIEPEEDKTPQENIESPVEEPSVQPVEIVEVPVDIIEVPTAPDASVSFIESVEPEESDEPDKSEKNIVPNVSDSPEESIENSVNGYMEEPQTEQAEPSEEPDGPATYIPEDEEEFVEHSAERSSFGTGFIAGLITGLAIGALALVGYMIYYIN